MDPVYFGAVRDLLHDPDERSEGQNPIRKAFWTYTTPEDVLREINGDALFATYRIRI